MKAFLQSSFCRDAFLLYLFDRIDKMKENKPSGRYSEGEEMMVLSKKEMIINATRDVIVAEGIDQFTLDSVAEKANVSKGGLLYHFPSKDALMEAMNEYAAKDFRKLVMSYIDRHTFHEAYVLATKETLKNKTILRITTSLLAALSLNRDLLHIWKEEYAFINEQLQKETYDTQITLLVKSVCDGLWFSALFPFDFMKGQEQQAVLDYLLQLLQGE